MLLLRESSSTYAGAQGGRHPCLLHCSPVGPAAPSEEKCASRVTHKDTTASASLLISSIKLLHNLLATCPLPADVYPVASFFLPIYSTCCTSLPRSMRFVLQPSDLQPWSASACFSLLYSLLFLRPAPCRPADSTCDHARFPARGPRSCSQSCCRVSPRPAAIDTSPRDNPACS